MARSKAAAEPRPAGRPSKLTDGTMTDLRNALKTGCTIEVACARAGIGKSTYHEWIARANEGGVYEQLREMVRATLAEAHVAALKQIDALAEDGENAEGGVVRGSWQAAAWRAEHTERILRNLDEDPDPVSAHQWRRGEWDVFPFLGGPEMKEKKVDFLAHLEHKLNLNWACRSARVHRWEVMVWLQEDPIFNECYGHAHYVASHQPEEPFLRAAMTPDKDGKVQALPGCVIMNANTAAYGLLKAQTFGTINSKTADKMASTAAELVPADANDELRRRLAGVEHAARSLPSGASLK